MKTCFDMKAKGNLEIIYWLLMKKVTGLSARSRGKFLMLFITHH